MKDIITGERISELVKEILGWKVKKSDKYNNYRSLNEKVYFSEWLSNSKYGWHLTFEVRQELMNRHYHMEVNYFYVKSERNVKKILRHFKKLNALSKTSVSSERPKDII